MPRPFQGDTVADWWLSAGPSPDYSDIVVQRAYQPRHAAPTYWRLTLALRRALPGTRLASAGPALLRHQVNTGDQPYEADPAYPQGPG